MDGFTEGYGCSPKTDTYNVIGDSLFGTDCSAANPGDLCGESLCSCNINFIQRVFAQNWIIPSVYTDEYLHSKGFDNDICHNPQWVKISYHYQLKSKKSRKLTITKLCVSNENIIFTRISPIVK